MTTEMTDAAKAIQEVDWRKGFGTESDQLSRTAEVVRNFVAARPDERVKMRLSSLDTRLQGDCKSTIQDAISSLQSVMKKESWVMNARITWLEAGLLAWETLLEDADSSSGIFEKHRVDLVLCDANRYRMSGLPIGVNTISEHLKYHFVGVKRYKLMDRWLDILQRLHHDHGLRWAKDSMRHVLQRRSGCVNPARVPTDNLVYKLLCQHYNIEPYMI